MAPTPTHRITHNDGSEADIDIAPSLQQQLYSIAPDARQRARSSICINFREACASKFGQDWKSKHPFISWEDIHVMPLPPKAPASARRDDEVECDDCASCDIGYHGRCGKNGGCPRAARR